jgi:hypothetical protein
MANFLSGFLNNLGQGITQPKGNLGDFQHAARLYNSNAFRLAPKTKYLYHVVFNVNPGALKSTAFRMQHLNTVNLLVKSVDLPGFKISVDGVQQYNRKKQVQTKLEYDPVSVVFHDDNAGITTQLWALYYGYYFADSAHSNSAGSIIRSGISNAAGFTGSSFVGELLGSGSAESATPAAYQRNTYKSTSSNKYRFGLDNYSSVPFFTSIQIFQLSRKEYQSFTLINPIITNWKHDNLDQSDTGVSANSMTVAYEAVIYGNGPVAVDNPKGFATEYYDKSPSPLSLLGGGTRSLFGTGGVLGGLGGVLGDITSGKSFSSPGALLGTLVRGANLARNTKGLSSEGIRQEGFGLLKGALGTVSNRSLGGVANVFIPKTSGFGQNISTPSFAATDAPKSGLTANQISGINASPTAQAAAFRQAQAVGALPPTATSSDLTSLLNSGSNAKLNGLARKILGNL